LEPVGNVLERVGRLFGYGGDGPVAGGSDHLVAFVKRPRHVDRLRRRAAKRRALRRPGLAVCSLLEVRAARMGRSGGADRLYRSHGKPTLLAVVLGCGVAGAALQLTLL
jgi:hypothetical protein